RASPLALPHLAAPGDGGHGLLPSDRHPERHPRGSAGRPLLGQRRQGVRVARALAALVLGRPSADLVLLSVPRVAAVVGLGHRRAPRHPRLRTRLVFRPRPHAPHARPSGAALRAPAHISPARITGLPESLVIGKHAFKNALIPVLTLAGINLVIMINVAVVVETVFAWPGIGRLLYGGITFRDFPVV